MTGQERICGAVQDQREAQLLVSEGIGNKAALAKIYHAMMQSLLALLGVGDIGRLTHADIIERFEHELIDSGRVGGEHLRVLRRTYDLTHECGCEHMPVPTDAEVVAAQRSAASLLRKAEEHVTGGGRQ